MGVILAFLALAAWGLGDFLIQRSARAFGDWVALFYITAFATIVLFPFVISDLPRFLADQGTSLVLWLTSLVLLFASLFDFEALRVGKMSVVEPVYAMEVPITVMLGIFVLREFLSAAQGFLITCLMIGIFLVATRSFRHLKNIHAEKGVWLAVTATLGMGVVNFLFGVGARETNPLVINWFTSAFLAVVTFAYLASQRRLGEITADWHHNRRLILSVSFFDNLAWVAYAGSTTYIPIAISTGISESYIALAATLGLVFNKEKLQRHQWFGLVVSVIAVVILAFITKN